MLVCRNYALIAHFYQAQKQPLLSRILSAYPLEQTTILHIASKSFLQSFLLKLHIDKLLPELFKLLLLRSASLYSWQFSHFLAMSHP